MTGKAVPVFSGKEPGPNILAAWAEQKRQDAKAAAKEEEYFRQFDAVEIDLDTLDLTPKPALSPDHPDYKARSRENAQLVDLAEWRESALTRDAYRAGELPQDRPAPPPMIPLISVTDETRGFANAAREGVRELIASASEEDVREVWCDISREMTEVELFEGGGLSVDPDSTDWEPTPDQAEILDQYVTDHRDAWPGQAEQGGLFAWNDARDILRKEKWAVLKTERAAAARREAEKAERKAKDDRPAIYRHIDKALKALPRHIADDDLYQVVFKLASKHGLDKNARRYAAGEIAQKTNLTRPEANRLIVEAIKNVKAAKPAPKRKKDSIAIVNEWSDSEMADWSQDNLAAAKDENGDPRVYTFEGDVCDMHNRQRRMLGDRQYAAINNSVNKYAREKQDGERRGEFAPKGVIDHNFHRSDKPYSKLTEVKSAPFVANDGRRVDKHGYDAPTMTYLDLGGLEVPPVSDVPSTEDVRKAKELIFEMIGDFPFDGVTDRDEREARFLRNEGEPLPSAAHAVCLMIERAARDLINGPTPVYAPTKPKPGTGAGELVGAITLAATGRKAAAEAMPTTDEEYTKVMSANICDSGEYAFFDNMNAALNLGTFASNVTEGRVRARLLGSSRMIEAEVRHTWIAAANNIKGTAEILRRLVMIELDSKLAHPGERVKEDFRHPDLSAWVEKHRPELVWAILTLIQNWVARGMKPWAGQPKASFVSWSRVMGGILRDADIRGFLENEKRLRSYGATGGDSSVEVFMQHLAENYPSGTLLRAGGISPIRGRAGETVVSLKDEFNVADDGKPLLIDGYGYNREDQQYNHARGIASKFRDAARGAYEVTLYEMRPNEDGEMEEVPVPYAVSFKEEPDPKSPSQYYWELVVTEAEG